MKLKSKDKKKAVADAHNKKVLGKIARFDNGGNGQNWTNLSPTDSNAGIGSQFSAPSVNNTQMPSYQTQQNPTVTPNAPAIIPSGSASGGNSFTSPSGGAPSVGQMAGWSAGAANALSGVWQGQDTSNIATRQDSAVAPKVFGSVKEIGKSIPVVGGFVQAGDTLGKGFEVAINKANEKPGSNRNAGASMAAFAQGLVDPIAEHQKVWQLQKQKKISTGEAVGWTALNFLGGAGIGSAVLEKKNKKDLHPDLFRKPNQTQGNNPVDQQAGENLLQNLNNNPVTAQNGLRGMSKYANGGDGQLEQYNTGLHKNMPESFANAQLDGKPIQLQRKESIFRKKNGGDYVFTDNLMNPETGNLISEDAGKIDKKVQKPFYDEASLKTKNFKMEKLANLNDKIRGSVEQKSEFPMYAKNGLRGSYNVDGTYEQPNLTGTGGKIDALLNQEQPINYTNYQGNVSANPSLNVDLQSNNGTGTRFATNTPSLNPRPTLKSAVDKQGNNLTTGDYIQMAGSAVAPIANIANFARKAEKVKAHLDNTQYSDPRIAKDFNPLYLAENAAAQDIDKGSLSDSVRRAARVSLTSGTQRNLQDYSLAVDNQNKGLQMQSEQMLAGTNRFNANQLTNRDTAQSQTNAVRRNYLNTGLQAGQSMVDFGKMKNQGLTNNIELSTLNELAANYGVSQETMKKLIKDGKISLNFKT